MGELDNTARDELINLYLLVQHIKHYYNIFNSDCIDILFTGNSRAVLVTEHVYTLIF